MGLECMAIPFRGFEVVYAPLYLTVGWGYAGPSITKLRQFRTWLGKLRQLWLLFRHCQKTNE